MKKILIFPNTNTFSHLARAFTLAEWLKEAGYEVHLGLSESRIPWAVIYYNSGTLPKNSSLLNDIVRECLNENFNILLSTSRQDDCLKHPHIFSSPYLSPSAATEMADMVICSGGIGACYINLLHETPSLILPEQPEQATNGIHLERAGCGQVLMKNIPYIGNSDVYYSAFSMEHFKSALGELLCSHAYRNSLHKASGELQRLVQAQTLVQTVESLL